MNLPVQKLGCLLVLAALCAARSRAENSNSLAEVVSELRQQNELLKQQVQRQNDAIEALNRKVAVLEEKSGAGESPDQTVPATFGSAVSSRVHLSGEGAVGFFKSGSEGQHPNGDFRVDEARLFLDAAVWGNVYGFLELNLATRESSDLNAELGEAYLDFESVSKLWGQENQLSLRAGRMDVPFGEEYLYRDAIDNPLISHSVMDFWAVDEGVELYGALGGVNYVVAVQNGGIAYTSDFTGDKSVTMRVSGDPARWLHLGASAMRTGDLTPNDWSALWVADGFFRPIGSPAVSQYHVNLAQGDARVRLPHGHLHFAGGFARYDDNDAPANNRRDFWFWSAEAVQNLGSKLYAGARFSQVRVADGYPLVGQGDFSDFFFGDLTQELWRLSLGVGYRFSDNLVLKTEYSIERGRTVTGQARDQEDLFSAAAAFKF